MGESWQAYFYRAYSSRRMCRQCAITSALPVRTVHGPVLRVDLDTPLGQGCGSEVIAVPGATVAIEDRQTEGVHIVRWERIGPSVQRKLAHGGSVDGARALGLTAIPIGHDKEVPAG